MFMRCTVTVVLIQMVETLGPLPRPFFSQGKFYEQLKQFTQKEVDQSGGNIIHLLFPPPIFFSIVLLTDMVKVS